MTPSEAEKEFEEWWEKTLGDNSYSSSYHWAYKAYFEAHSRQQKEIEKLKSGIKKIIYSNSSFDYQYIHKTVLHELKKLLNET